MSILGKIKQGVKYMAMAFEQTELTSDMILYLISQHKASKRTEWMNIGERYYDVDNDILNVNTKNKEKYQADNRLVHATYKNLVDEKIGYLLSKPASIRAESNDATQIINKILSDDIQYDLEELGLEASNKGIAWLHPYIDEDGKLRRIVIPAEQIIPLWHDKKHIDLDAVIRVYSREVWRFGRFVKIENVEVWDKNTVTFYRIDGGQLLQVEQPKEHYAVDGNPRGWNKVPWIPFKNNKRELPDIKFVKSIIDNYDLTRSDIANYIAEIKNLIFVLKGYSGDSVDELLELIYQKRAVALDADEDGQSGIDTIEPKMNIETAKIHYEQLRRDIIDSGQGVNRDLDKFGSAPSGVALQFLFSGLEFKGNALESEFRRGFKEYIKYIYEYLKIIGAPISEETVTITFNRDMIMDETAIIENCNASRGTVSQDTILANHPWISNVFEEKEKLKKEEIENGFMFNTAPIKAVNGDGEE